MIPRDRLARLHYVNTLFHALTGHDLYLASQVLEAIEAATADVPALRDDPTAFSAAVEYLHQALTGSPPDSAFTYLDGAAPGAPGLLWLREGLIQVLQQHRGKSRATVFVANVGEALPQSTKTHTPRRKRSRAHQHEQAEAVAQLRAVAGRRADPHSVVTLLFV